MELAKNLNFEKKMGKIRSFGFNIVWRDSNTVRYLRVNLFLWDYKFQHDFFLKVKL
jgi:hypothetical protein